MFLTGSDISGDFFLGLRVRCQMIHLLKMLFKNSKNQGFTLAGIISNFTNKLAMIHCLSNVFLPREDV